MGVVDDLSWRGVEGTAAWTERPESQEDTQPHLWVGGWMERVVNRVDREVKGVGGLIGWVKRV